MSRASLSAEPDWWTWSFTAIPWIRDYRPGSGPKGKSASGSSQHPLVRRGLAYLWAADSLASF
jgi:hypothetical protein